jgi:hypothetical protein
MKRLTLLAAAFIVLGMGTSSRALIVFKDDFNSYFDGSGNPDQAAFTAVWTPIGCQGQGASCTLNTSSTTSNEVSNDFVGVDALHDKAIKNHSPVGSPGTSDSAERNQITFTASPVLATGDRLEFSFDFYDLTPAGNPYRQFMNMQSSTAPGTTPAGQLIGLGLNNNQLNTQSGGNYYMARVLGYSNPIIDPDGGPNEQLANTNFIKLNDHDPTPTDTVADGPGPRGTVAAWHNLKAVISTADGGTTTDYNFYVDGVHAEHINQAGAPRQYSVLRMGAGVSSTSDAYYDNVLVEYIQFVPTNSADFNGDHVIDASDYAVWRKFNPIASGATQATGDANGDGDNDGSDYDAWRATFGNAVGAGSGGGLSGSNVPEPASFVMAVLATAFGVVARRRQA